MQVIALHFCCLSLVIASCAETDTSYMANNDPPLISAAEAGDLSMLNQLLEGQTALDIRNICQWTPLMKAALNGHLEVAKQLVDAGATVDLTDKGGYTAMMLAASNNHDDVVDFLLDKGANVNQVENTAGWTALIWAAKSGHLETVKVLLAHKANPDLFDLQGKRALDWANAGKFEAISSLF